MIIRTENSRITFILLSDDVNVEGICINDELPIKEENGMDAILYYTEEKGLYYEYTERPVQIYDSIKKQSTIEEHIIDLIRAKYTVDQEIAINRQRDTKPEEFQEYFDFCEQCKQKAHEIII